jgi:hypothetical protein
VSILLNCRIVAKQRELITTKQQFMQLLQHFRIERNTSLMQTHVANEEAHAAKEKVKQLQSEILNLRKETASTSEASQFASQGVEWQYESGGRWISFGSDGIIRCIIHTRNTRKVVAANLR